MQTTPASRPQNTPEQIAAVDLGSNSFHMIIARMHGSELKLIDRLREQVRLAEGLDSKGQLSDDAQQRALDCLRRFGQRLAGLPTENLRIVGTNTLRSAKNAGDFLERAEEVLGHPIEVISGIEEARLIYGGVVHSLAADSEANRFVIDIGGGSTELIIGRGFRPLLMESLYIGCITLTKRFFSDGRLTQGAFDQALLEAWLELEPKIEAYRMRGWSSAIGASGTALAINRVLAANGWSKGGISPAGMRKFMEAMLKAGTIDALKLEGLSRERAQIIPGGFAILLATIEALGIERMGVSDGALREGLLHDLIGRHHDGDARDASVEALAARYHIDEQQAKRVELTVLECLSMVADEWKLDTEEDARWLRWSARLHEIGLDIAHSNYQKHGAYIIAHADLAGFSYQEQQLLALLVLAHRRKFPAKELKDVKSLWGKKAERLILLLRLAILLQRSRGTTALPGFRLEGRKKYLALHLPPDWLDAHPLTRADLGREVQYLTQIGVTLEFD
jgi:exopolyphosphatase / guanosine-5'-triphosphate,3'-diphosphate pyrophosphatase